MSFTCPDCFRTSSQLQDELELYCGECHAVKPVNLRFSFFQRRLVGALRSEHPSEALRFQIAHRRLQMASLKDIQGELRGLAAAPGLPVHWVEYLNLWVKRIEESPFTRVPYVNE